MKILSLDSVGGASGDMILGALADLGADLGRVEARLRAALKTTFWFAAIGRPATWWAGRFPDRSAELFGHQLCECIGPVAEVLNTQ